MENKAASLSASDINDGLFRQIVKNANQGIIIHQNFKPLFVNKAWAKLHGRTVKEVMSSQNILEYFYAENRDRAKKYAESRISGGHAPESYEYYACHKNGDRLCLQNHVQVVKINEQDAILSMVSDIGDRVLTEEALQESELRMKTLLDNSPIAIYFKDANLHFITANKAYEEIYDVSEDIYLGKSSRQVYPASIADVYEQHDRDVLERRHAITREDVIDDQTLLVVKFPIFSPSGGMIGLGGIEMDVTDMKKTETALIEAKHNAELANKTKTDFLANMSHELRTPLNSIIGFSELMTEEIFGSLGHESYLEYAKYIHLSGHHLLKVISDILDISKIEAGEFTLSEQQTNISDIVDFCIRMVSERADKEDIMLIVNLEQDVPDLFCDPVRLKQILLNLLSNAIKFTDKDTTIKLSVFVNDQGNLSISVSDQGIGIASENIEKILKPFEQVRRASNVAHEGTGLGLYLTKSLIEMHEGQLIIESKLGQGTTVYVEFPKQRIILN